jgi:hypothetical protein
VPAAPLTSSLQDPRVLAFLLALFGVNLLFGLGSISMAGVEQAILHGRRISAGSLPVSWHSPHSIPFRSRRAAARMKAWTRRPPAINLNTIAGCALLAMPRRSRRRSACAANAVLVVIPARGGHHLVQTA